MTSKRNITSHVKRVFGKAATYREHGSDVLGWHHAQVEASKCQINAHGRTIGEARGKIAALLESVRKDGQ